MDRSIATSVKDRQLVHERRQRLVRAALKVFTRKGYHRATVREIGRAAGFTQGTIYNYVRSKGDILYLVCDEKVRAHQAALARALEGVTEPTRRLERALEVLVEAIHAHEETVLLVYRESHALDRRSLHAILGRVAQLIDTVEAILLDARRQGRLAFGDPRVAANIVTFLPLILAMRRWDFERQAVDRRTLDQQLVRFMRLGLGFQPGRGNGDHGGR
jgi:TetR/AcrR family transcriptional regulator, cholesterol catabolism regulator